MFSHIMVGANDIEQSKTFYDATLGTLGYNEGIFDEKGRCFYMSETGIFAITNPINGEPASHGNGSTIGFIAESIEEVDAWHQAGLTAGGVACEAPPGIREGRMKYYIAYLRDPSNNKVCVVHTIK